MKNLKLITILLTFLTVTFSFVVNFLFYPVNINAENENYLVKNNINTMTLAKPISNEPIKTETVEEEIKVEIAPINDKEDGGKATREVDNSKIKSIQDAKKEYEASGTSFGIDVSKYQGKIDWAKVKQSGVDFAMIRVGYRGYETGKLVIDPYFYQNIEGALKNGIQVGVYFYSVAINETEAIEEAKLTLKVIKNYKITYPVAYDFEDFDRYRCKGVSYEQLNKNAVAFLNTIKNAGYTPMHYGSKSKFGSIWNMSVLNNYKIWLAHYTTKTNYSGKYNMWQYTSSGRVSGINTVVDLNIAYFKYTNNESDKANNESQVTKDPNQEAIDKVTFTDVNETVITTENLKMRMSPTTELDNIILTIPADTEITRVGVSDEWSKVTYDNKTGYVYNTYLKIKEEEIIEEE